MGLLSHINKKYFSKHEGLLKKAQHYLDSVDEDVATDESSLDEAIDSTETATTEMLESEETIEQIHQFLETKYNICT